MVERISLDLNCFPSEFEDWFYLSRKIPNPMVSQEYFYLAWFEYLIFYYPERIENTINIFCSKQNSWSDEVQYILRSRDCNELDNLSFSQVFRSSLSDWNSSKNKTISQQFLNLSKSFQLKIIKIRQSDDLMISVYGNSLWPSLYLFFDRKKNYFILYPFCDKIPYLDNWIYRFPNRNQRMIECICLKWNSNACKCSQLIRSLSDGLAFKMSWEEHKQDFPKPEPIKEQNQEKLTHITSGSSKNMQYNLPAHKIGMIDLQGKPSKMYENRVKINETQTKNKSSEGRLNTANEMYRKRCEHDGKLYFNHCGCELCRACSLYTIINRKCKICKDIYETDERKERVKLFFSRNCITKSSCLVCQKLKTPSLLIFLLPKGCCVCKSTVCKDFHFQKCNSCLSKFENVK